MKKSKILKTLGFSSLALLIAAGGTFAFAPLGASPNSLANASEIETSTEQGLITPKADDPVIYTTENGLNIKWGTLSINTSLGTGNLNGFPYFTTNDGSKTYTWVIIGRNADTSVFSDSISQYLFSNWKTTHNTKIGKIFNSDGYYYFNNTYETTSPAGNMINSIIPTKTYVSDFATSTTIKTNPEIPSGCVLVLANECVENAAYNVSYAYAMAPYRFSHYRSDANTDFKSTMDGYYTNKSLGLASLIDQELIQSVTVKTYEYQWYDTTWNNRDDGTWAWRLPSLTAHIFPLCSRADGSTFTWSTYLTANQMKLSGNQWLRGGGDGTNGHVDVNGIIYFNGEYLNTDGTNTIGKANDIYGYRPAFCLKLT